MEQKIMGYFDGYPTEISAGAFGSYGYEDHGVEIVAYNRQILMDPASARRLAAALLVAAEQVEDDARRFPR